MAKHNVKCVFCNQIFDANVEPYIKVSNGRRYAHQACAAAAEKKEVQEKNNLEILEDYIKYLYHTDTLDPKISKQIQKLVNMPNSKYTYSGIQRALQYFYEVKKNPLPADTMTIGIVEWIYQDAYNYYYNLWLINQKNGEKRIEDYIPNIVEVKIPQPELKPRKRKLFTFLDEEEKESDE